MSQNGQETDTQKKKRVNKELKNLNRIFANVEDNKRSFVQRHIEQLAWYNVSIIDLQRSVDQWGTLVQYDNGGGQTGIRANPDIKTLIDYQKAANTIIRTLISLVPEGYSTDGLSEFKI